MCVCVLDHSSSLFSYSRVDVSQIPFITGCHYQLKLLIKKNLSGSLTVIDPRSTAYQRGRGAGGGYISLAYTIDHSIR